MKDSWRPISTAPRDGTEFLGYGSYVYHGDKDPTEYFELVYYRLNGDDEYPWSNGMSALRTDQLSHWQPLEAPDDPA